MKCVKSASVCVYQHNMWLWFIQLYNLYLAFVYQSQRLILYVGVAVGWWWEVGQC